MYKRFKIMDRKAKGSQEFYEKEVSKRREAVDTLIEDISYSIVSECYRDKEFMINLQRNIKQCKILGDMKKQFPNYSTNPTSKQFSSAISSKKHCYHYSEFLTKAIDESFEDKNLERLFEFSKLKVAEKVKYYLIQAQKCYYFECWDACIVMIARTIEYSLKEYLKKENGQVQGFQAMGSLITSFEKHGKKQDILKYIFEVQKMDRNICAHDSDKERQQMSKDEADHSWSAIRIILKELLEIKID